MGKDAFHTTQLNWTGGGAILHNQQMVEFVEVLDLLLSKNSLHIHSGLISF